MDEENEVKEEKNTEEHKKESKSNKEKGGNGLFTGLQFLNLIVLISIVALQYLQFEKVDDIGKRLNEEGKLVEKTQKSEVSMADIELFEVVKGGTYNVKNGKDDRYLKMTVNLGINTKDKAYKKDNPVLAKQIEIIKETVEKIVTSTDMSYFDGLDKEYTVKQRIIDELNSKFNTSIIVEVYFSDKMKA